MQENVKARRIEKVSRREKDEKRWWGSYCVAVEFHWANREPITERDTCKLTDKPIAS